MLNVVCGLIIMEGKLLVARLGRLSDHPFKWEFPGGKVKIGKAPGEAIIREIKEELEIDIRVLAELDYEIYDYRFKQIKLIPFICELTHGFPVLHEHINFSWEEISELKKLDLAEADKQILENKQSIKTLFEYIRKNMDCSSQN